MTSMSKKAVYILGLFESEDNALFSHIQSALKHKNIHCIAIELYSKSSFGSYSFKTEVDRIAKELEEICPDIVLAHSLGAYTLMQIPMDYEVILLDPSLPISVIIMSNLKEINGTYWYDDETTRLPLSLNFIESLKLMPPIEELVGKKNKSVSIFGAENGGQMIAAKYHQHIPYSKYTCIKNADHNFTNQNHRNQILNFIK